MYGKCHCGDSSAKLRRNVSDKPAILKEHEFIVHFWNFKVKAGESKKVIVKGKKAESLPQLLAVLNKNV